jgi:hypothetical protein
MARKLATGILLAATVCIVGTFAYADDIALTVYNSNLGVVRETRNLEFSEGVGRIGFTDVASQIDATSVTFELADPDKAVDILEQNYAYDLVSPDKIYNKYIDKTITVMTEQGELYTGTLLSSGGGYIVLRESDGTIRSIVMGSVRDVSFPELPEGLITRPTLFWLYQSDFNGPADAIVSYQTSGINWHAEYVGVLDDSETELDLTGWVSIDNRSGKTYEDARLKVIAGDINRALQQQPVRFRGAGVETMAAMPEKMDVGFEEKAFFEYHMYTLPRKATLANNEIKQISMFEPAHADVKKELRYLSGTKNVDVYILMNNSKEVGLGMPLPAGRVRVFKADTDQSLILLGEDRIKHTPRNEEVELKIGKAFDIVGETTQVSFRRVSDRISETDYRIEIRNQKDSAETVIVTHNVGGDWEILNASRDFVKKSAFEIEWTVDVPAEDKAVIDFTVRVTRN